MTQKLTLPAVLAASGLAAALAGSPALADGTEADAQWVDGMVEAMMHREGMKKQDMARLTDTLIRAYQEQNPGDYFDTYSSDRVAKALDAYGESNLASLLSDWDTSAPTQQPMETSEQSAQTTAGEASKKSSARQPTLMNAQQDANDTATNTAAYGDGKFASHMLEKMARGKSLHRDDVDRFESIIMNGKGEGAMQEVGRKNVANLLATYGMDDALRSLSGQEAVAGGSRSAADRLAGVTSADSVPGDYRDEFLAKADRNTPTGVERYENAVMTVYDENLEPYTLNDPVAGKRTQRSVTSCLYRSTKPQPREPGVTQTMQLLDLPETITASRFIERTREGQVITNQYELSRVALDWGEATNVNVRAYFYGNIIPPREQIVRPNGRVEWYQPPTPPPEWHTFACSPRSVRT